MTDNRTITKFYTTRITVDLIITTQFGPQDAVNLIKYNNDIPAVQSMKVTGLITDYVPLTEQDSQRPLLIPDNFPITLKEQKQ